MQDLFLGLLRPTYFRRFLFFFLSDISVVIVSLYLSFLLRFEFVMSASYQALFLKALPLFILIKLAAFAVFKLYRITWRYVGIKDFFNIINATIVANSILLALILVPSSGAFSSVPLPQFNGFPRSIFFIDGVVSLLLLSALRISKRFYLEIVRNRRASGRGKPTVIIGAGNTGEMILRDMVKQEFSEFYPVALLDDDSKKIGSYLHGVKVIGTTQELRRVIAKCSAEAVIIAIPSLDHKTLRNLYNTAKGAKVKTVKIVPRIYDFNKVDVNLKSLEEISIEDLIGRQSITVDFDEIEILLKDKAILITGGGGSIGSEITMQTCAFSPRKLVLFDIDETALHTMYLKIKRNCPHLMDKVFFITGDIRDEQRVVETLKAHTPEIVFHAAAYKHVPMMESNPKEAVKVNIFGTYTLAKASVNCGVRKFIMISTDKAVRPTSIMGATKRMAEGVCKAFNGCNEGTSFVSVRFGNVLGSRGSVLPLFLDQLKHGGPLTVTHKDMQRYFMTIPEAVSLVLQASVIGKSGDVLVLDMGEPVKIVNLAEELIRIHGLEPYVDVDIEFVGLRPGEKLFEEILTAEEGTVASKHKQVFVAKNSEIYSREKIEGILEEFRTMLQDSRGEEASDIRNMLRKYVRHYGDN